MIAILSVNFLGNRLAILGMSKTLNKTKDQLRKKHKNMATKKYFGSRIKGTDICKGNGNVM